MKVDQSVLDAVKAKLNDMDDLPKRFLAMLYGPMGGGKTTLAMRIAQAITPPDKFILYLDSAQNWVVLGPELTKRTKRLHLSGYLGVVGAGALVESGQIPDIATVIIDEHSSFFDSDLQEVTEMNAKKDKDKNPDHPVWPDMNQTINRWVKNLNDWLAMDLNIILVAHERTDKDDRQVVVTQPNYLPKGIVKMCRPMHLVGLVTADINESADSSEMFKRTVQVHPSRRVVAKNRLPGLPIHATFDQVVEAAVTLVLHNGALQDNTEISVLNETDPATIGD